MKEREVKGKELEARRKELEAMKKEREARRKEEAAKRKEEESGKKEEEVRKREEEVRKRTEDAQQKELEARQKSEALDVDMICARLFILLQAPESFKKFMSLQGHQAQDMMDLLQKVRLVFMPHIHSSDILTYILSMLAVGHAHFRSYL